MAIKLLRC